MCFAVCIDVDSLDAYFFYRGMCMQRFDQHICFVFKPFARQGQVAFDQFIWNGPKSGLRICNGFRM